MLALYDILFLMSPSKHGFLIGTAENCEFLQSANMK